MDEMSDGELLRRYAAGGSQEAFARLAGRHVDKVYSAARRQVRSPHQADDVTQAVFVALARKAAALSGHASIGGWLLKATHLAVKNLRRIESRRRRHELRAAQQRTLDMSRLEKDTNPEADAWNGISPLLDAALAVLPDAVRDALTLRYLEGLDFASVARTLGISEQAARKRVERGIEKLRGIFAARGINVPADLLGQLLLIHAVGPAPQAVAQAAAGAAAAVKHLTLAKGLVTVMAWSKAKIAAACAAGILLVGGGGAVVHHVLAGPRQRMVVDIGSTPPVISAVAPLGGFELHGQVVSPDGLPVAGARVIASTGPRFVNIFTDPRLPAPEAQATTMTDATGSFRLIAPARPEGVVVTCPQGIGRATTTQLAKNARVELMPWARIEGDIVLDGNPATGAQLLVSDFRQQPRVELNAMADAKGHYVIAQAPPGKLYMSCIPSGQRSLNGGITASPGGNCTADFITRDGRTIVAHLGQVPVSGEVVALLNLEPQPPADGEGHFVPSAYQQDCTAKTGAQLRFDHIPPGEYRLYFSLMDFNHPGKVYIADIPVSVPASPSPTAVDLGTITLRPMDTTHQGPPPKSATTKPESRPQ